jgi:hypothetical protein
MGALVCVGPANAGSIIGQYSGYEKNATELTPEERPYAFQCRPGVVVVGLPTSDHPLALINQNPKGQFNNCKIEKTNLIITLKVDLKRACLEEPVLLTCTYFGVQPSKCGYSILN